MEKNRSCRQNCVWDAHSNYMRKEQCIDYHSWLWFYSWCCWRVFLQAWLRHLAYYVSIFVCVFACVLSQELVRHQTLPAWQSVQTEWFFRPCWKTQWGSSIGALTLQDCGCIIGREGSMAVACTQFTLYFFQGDIESVPIVLWGDMRMRHWLRYEFMHSSSGSICHGKCKYAYTSSRLCVILDNQSQVVLRFCWLFRPRDAYKKYPPNCLDFLVNR